MCICQQPEDFDDEDWTEEARLEREREMGENDDVTELEDLLEAFNEQINGTFNRLATLREYVDDTEDYISISQVRKQEPETITFFFARMAT